MPWYLLKEPSKKVYVEAEDEVKAKEKAASAGYTAAPSGGPHAHLWEATAKDRYCDFGNGIWVDRPVKDKLYGPKYVKLEDYLKTANIVILGDA